MHAQEFLKLANHPLKFRLFLLSKLPAALWSGLRVSYADEEQCIITIPYKWFTKNPFRSTYFACLSMAAEMSTGILAMAHLHKLNPPVSMLVVGVTSSYLKKAIGVTTFTCNDGLKFKSAIEQAIGTGMPQSFSAKSIGVNASGETVAEFSVTWSFKIRASR